MRAISYLYYVFLEQEVKYLVSIAGTNPIYNLLPDILGKLSSKNLAGESFCNIMHFLIGSIKKVPLVQYSWVLDP